MAKAARSVALEVLLRLKNAGHQAFWVGGCVRDLLLERDPEDFDIATSALPAEIEALFPHTIPVGRQFGIVVVVEKGHQLQVATFRAESGYQDGRHPDRVEFADAERDARRRDFTVNGLFYDPVEERTCDWVGGEADLRAKLIRTIGRPDERFAEDHLRMLRAVRFAAQLGFDIEQATEDAIQANAPQIKRISAERVRDELMKLFKPPHAARGLDELHRSRLLAQVLPEIEAMVECEQSPDFHPEGTVFEHVRLILEKLPPDASPWLVWAALLHDVGKPVTSARDLDSGRIRFHGHERVGAEMAEAILRRLRFPRKAIEQIVACVRNHMQFKDVRQMRRATLRRMILRSTFPLELELHRLDCLGSHGALDNFHFLEGEKEALNQHPSMPKPLISGDDVLRLGIPPGPRVGRLLRAARDRQLQETLQTRNDALEWLKKEVSSGTE